MIVITTPRLLLRPPKGSDLNDFYEYARNPNVGPNAGWKPHANLRETLDILTDFIRMGNVWAIVDKLTGKMIGTIGLLPDQKRDNLNVKMLGYALSQSFWGRGMATEAARAVIEYGFLTENLSMISAYHYTGNNRSKSVLAKCGFYFEGVLRKSAPSYDKTTYFDEACYSLTKEEYLKAKSARV